MTELIKKVAVACGNLSESGAWLDEEAVSAPSDFHGLSARTLLVISRLGFWVEEREGLADILVWADETSRPASGAEVAMWKLLTQGREL